MTIKAKEQVVNTIPKSKVKIQIEFYFKQYGKYKDHEHIVQGEKFTWGIKITNISNTKSQKGKITSANLTNTGETFNRYSNDFPKNLKELEPNGYDEIEFDTTSIYVEGMCWAIVDLEPDDNRYEYETYQLNTCSGKEEKYSRRGDKTNTFNNWKDSIFVQKKMELIQSRTNTLILWLTIITVVESVFSIKSTLLFFINNFIKLYKLAIWFLENMKYILS